MSHRRKHGHVHHLSSRHNDGFGMDSEDLDSEFELRGAETDDDDPDGVGSGWVETITGLTEDHGATDLLINGSHLNKATKVPQQALLGSEQTLLAATAVIEAAILSMQFCQLGQR